MRGEQARLREQMRTLEQTRGRAVCDEKAAMSAVQKLVYELGSREELQALGSPSGFQGALITFLEGSARAALSCSPGGYEAAVRMFARRMGCEDFVGKSNLIPTLAQITVGGTDRLFPNTVSNGGP